MTTVLGSIPSLIETHAVTHTQCVPTRARMLLASERGAASLADIRKLLIGGEALTPELAKPLCHHIGGDVINVYGPTETTVWSWGHCVSPNEDPIPIGRPMANARFYVLDPNGQPVPVGVPGELYIAGPGVTRGYAERPDVTAKAFIPDPFNPEGGRMYRTGDRVAARPDGVLDYLGRLDFQVRDPRLPRRTERDRGGDHQRIARSGACRRYGVGRHHRQTRA